MLFMDLISNRRSVREYQDRVLEAEKIKCLVESALRAPSSRGLDPWEFVVVTEREILEKLSRAKPHGADFLKEAALGIVVCADRERSDVWIEDTSIASTYIWLAAESLGLGACWIQIRLRQYDESKTAEEYVSEILQLPSRLAVEAIMAIGYPRRKKLPRSREKLKWEKVYLNVYGQHFRGKGDS